MSEIPKPKNYKKFAQLALWTTLTFLASNLSVLAQTPETKLNFGGRPVVVGFTESDGQNSRHTSIGSGSDWFKGGVITNEHVAKTFPNDNYATENNKDIVQYKYKMTFIDAGFDLAILARSLKELQKQIEILLRQPNLAQFKNYLANYPLVTFETRRDKAANKEFDYK